MTLSCPSKAIAKIYPFYLSRLTFAWSLNYLNSYLDLEKLKLFISKLLFGLVFHLVERGLS